MTSQWIVRSTAARTEAEPSTLAAFRRVVEKRDVGG